MGVDSDQKILSAPPQPRNLIKIKKENNINLEKVSHKGNIKSKLIRMANDSDYLSRKNKFLQITIT